MSVSIMVHGAAEMSKRFQAAAQAIERALEQEIKKAQYMVQREAKWNVTGGRPLHVGKPPGGGRLRSSITVSSLQKKGKEIFGTVGTNVVYGAAHEFGARIQNGFGKGVLIVLPKRPWLGPAMDRKQDAIDKMFQGRVKAEMNKAGLA